MTEPLSIHNRTIKIAAVYSQHLMFAKTKTKDGILNAYATLVAVRNGLGFMAISDYPAVVGTCRSVAGIKLWGVRFALHFVLFSYSLGFLTIKIHWEGLNP